MSSGCILSLVGKSRMSPQDFTDDFRYSRPPVPHSDVSHDGSHWCDILPKGPELLWYFDGLDRYANRGGLTAEITMVTV
jgi:hypothetical protein